MVLRDWASLRYFGVLLLAAGALIAPGCGSSSGASAAGPATTRTQTSSALKAVGAVAGHELSLLAPPIRFGGADLSPPSTTATADRRYLTQLFDDAQHVWRSDFATAHLRYRPARLVLFWSRIESPCGRAEDSGPFYCPADQTIYLDLRFLIALRRQHGLGRVSDAYILGHEFGHHVQQLLGIARAVAVADRADPAERNKRSVEVELEADCLAGVWASSAYRRSRLDEKDLSDGLKSADVIGDDYIARAAGQLVDSTMWTHGSSKQRQQWLRTGFSSGRPEACNTFANR
jgi:predicted metalloprotease